MTDARQNIDVALGLARAGFHVFPCHAGGAKAKAPLNPPVMSWPRQSTCEATQVQRWWSAHPNAAIGLAFSGSALIGIESRPGERAFLKTSERPNRPIITGIK